MRIQFTDVLCGAFSERNCMGREGRGVFQQSTIESLPKKLSSEMRFFAHDTESKYDLCRSSSAEPWHRFWEHQFCSRRKWTHLNVQMSHSYFVHFAWMLFVCATIDLWQAADRINKSPVNEWIEWGKSVIILDTRRSIFLSHSIQSVSEFSGSGKLERVTHLPLLLRLHWQ